MGETGLLATVSFYPQLTEAAASRGQTSRHHSMPLVACGGPINDTSLPCLSFEPVEE